MDKQRCIVQAVHSDATVLVRVPRVHSFALIRTSRGRCMLTHEEEETASELRTVTQFNYGLKKP